MASRNIPLWISVTWLTLTIVAALFLDASSIRGWLLATAVGIIPIGVLLKLWNNGPPPTIAEVLHTTEDRR